MSKSESSAGYLRISQLMVAMIDAAEEGDKEKLIQLCANFREDADDFIGVLLMTAKVSDEDLEKLMPNPDQDEELLKKASEADMIKTAKVETRL
jgi:hypothetical protein